MPAEAIKTYSRFRPRNKAEMLNNENPKEVIWILNNQTAEVEMPETKKKRKFTFDHIFPLDTTQPQVFDVLGTSIVENVLNGFHSTLFAYGQTGAGKTFSLVGKLDNPNLFGLMPRCASYILNRLEKNPEVVKWDLQLQACEIYLEQVRDILVKSNKTLNIRQKKNGETYIEGISQKTVKTTQEIFELMNTAFSNRAVASTNMNAESSRSHCAFCIFVNQEWSDGQKKRARLYIIDLAGSERVAKTGAKGAVFEEAKAINSSLTALGNCINGLSTGKKHVNFRDSKLTYLLKDSLKGNCKTALLVAMTMDDWNIDETVSTLRFAERAKQIKNKVKINRDYSPAELKKLIASNKKHLIRIAEMMLSFQKEKFAKNKCEKPTRKFLQDMKDLLKEEFPKGGKVLEEKEMTAEMKSSGSSSGGKKGSKKSGKKGKKGKKGGKNEVSISLGGGSVDVMKREKEARISKIQADDDKISKENEQWQGKVDAQRKKEKEIAEKTSEYKEALDNVPIGGDDGLLPEVNIEENENDSPEITKYKRDLRVYKYTLELTRKEWKKNQKMALDKMNAHRKVIQKYKEDKHVLLNIVADLEEKLNEANSRLRDARQQQEEINRILGYAMGQD